MRRTPKRKFFVFTGNGRFETWAVSERQAISNIRYRFQSVGKFTPTELWRAEEAK